MTEAAPLLDPAAADIAVRPQDDLYAHVNGTWLRTHRIPADRGIDGAFHALRDQSEIWCRQICEEVAAGSLEDPDAARIALLWSRFMDEAGVEAAGTAPLAPELELIRGASDHASLARIAGLLQRGGVGALIGPWLGTDPHDSAATMLNLSQSGLGLPDEAYYREEAHAPVREAYGQLIATLLHLSTETPEPEAHRKAESVLAFETHLAAHHRDAVANRDPLKSDNPIAFADLPERFPGYDWASWATALGLRLEADALVNVCQPEFVAGACTLWAESDLDLLKDWLTVSLLDTRAPLLNSALVDAHFEFHGRTLSGTEELRPRWKRALSLIEGVLGHALGRLWVERHFPPAAKARMDELVEALLGAYATSIHTLDWLGEETKQKALLKLIHFVPKIGHPATWRSHEAMHLASTSDLVGAVRVANAFETDRELSKLGKPVDRSEWFLTPQTVNAYYNPTFNEIVFPAAILQPPFFDLDGDDAVNFGAIGAVIGHEIGHGFDDQGSRYDAAGNLENWWCDADRQRFEERTAALISQYDVLVPTAVRAQGEDSQAPHVNGALTVGENIGDLGGLSIAWKAFATLLADRGVDVHAVDTADDGLSPAQRFFISWARVWRTLARPEFARQMLAIDPHSPAEFRCNQVVKNMDAFAEAFGVAPGDGMWMDPADRVRIW